MVSPHLNTPPNETLPAQPRLLALFIVCPLVTLVLLLTLFYINSTQNFKEYFTSLTNQFSEEIRAANKELALGESRELLLTVYNADQLIYLTPLVSTEELSEKISSPKIRTKLKPYHTPQEGLPALVWTKENGLQAAVFLEHQIGFTIHNQLASWPVREHHVKLIVTKILRGKQPFLQLSVAADSVVAADTASEKKIEPVDSQ